MHCEALDRERTLKRWLADYVGFVGRVLRSAGTPAAEVDDAVQRTFIIAARKQADVRAGAERSFLAQTALHVAAHARRSAARRREAPASELPELVDAANPEQLTSLKHDRALLERVVAELPPELRSVLLLSEVEELSREEIAASLAIPAGTVASRLRRAREQVRERWRVERGAAAALGVAGLLAAVKARAAALGAWVARSALKVSAVAAAAVVPLAFVGWPSAPRSARPPEPLIAKAEPVVALAPPALPAVDAAPAPDLDVPPAPARPVVVPVVPALAPKKLPPAEALRQELAQLDVARARLASGRADQALGLLDAYERSAPRGALRLEAEVLRIDALSRSGRMQQAQARARVFLARYPNSVLAARVRRIAGQ
jgi:RNA polymerase sigma-70 factor (ECF subfamily)